MTPNQLHQTHTHVLLGISQAAYDEIKAKLHAAGYDYAFGADGEISLQGLAAVVEPAETPAPTHIALPPGAIFDTPLEWSEEQQPTRLIPFNHCKATTPFGTFAIHWPGWISSCTFSVDIPWGCEGASGFLSLQEAKDATALLWRTRLMSCLRVVAL